MALRSWHLAAAGFVAQLGFAAYAWLESPPATALDVVTHTLVVVLLVGLGAIGLLPAILLALPTHHQAGRWTALGLGILGVVAVFWVLQGLLLLAAFAWATWKERAPPAPSAVVAAGMK